jgi:hypothetical protein
MAKLIFVVFKRAEPEGFFLQHFSLLLRDKYHVTESYSSELSAEILKQLTDQGLFED